MARTPLCACSEAHRHAAAVFVHIVTRTHAYLAVSDLGVAVGVGGEDAPQRGDAGGVLEGGVVRQRAVEVALDLLRGQAAVAHRLLHQAAVVALMGLQLRGGICTTQRGGGADQ